MKKRHEVLAILAAAAGLSFVPTAEATVMTHSDISAQTAVSDEALSQMIQLAGAKGYEKSGNENAAGSPSKSPQGNGHAQGYSNSGNENAAGSPTKSRQGHAPTPS